MIRGAAANQRLRFLPNSSLRSRTYYGAVARTDSVTLPTRDENLQRMRRINSPGETNGGQQWDVVVVGGGATGSGAALDAASRGLKTVLLEMALNLLT